MNKYGSIIFIILTAGLLITGCSQDVDSTEGTDYLMAGYLMMAGDETPLPEDGTSRTSVTLSDAASSDTFDSWMSKESKLNNFPERGQKTYVTVTKYNEAKNIYFISARTEYPYQEQLIDYYLEEYYVKDDGDGKWSYDDIIVKPDGTSDPKYRQTMEVVFKDGSVRKEWIANIYDWTSNTYYAGFDINGDLAIPADWTGPEMTTDMAYSSEVHYYQKINNWISWFYKENKEIFGVRYYTETTGSKPIRTSLAFEHTISQNSPFLIGDVSFIIDFLNWIFGGGSGSGRETLSETVIRYEIAANGTKTVVSETNVVPTFGNTFTINNKITY